MLIATPPRTGSTMLAVAVFAGNSLSATATALDKQTNGAMSRAVKNSRFIGKKGDLLEILAPSDLEASSVMLFGLGEASDVSQLDLENLNNTRPYILNNYYTP